MDPGPSFRSLARSRSQNRNRQASLSSSLSNVTNYDDPSSDTDSDQEHQEDDADQPEAAHRTQDLVSSARGGPSGLSAELASRQSAAAQSINTNVPSQSSSAPSTVGPRSSAAPYFHASPPSPSNTTSSSTDRIAKRLSALSSSPSESSIAEERDDTFDSGNNSSSAGLQDHRPISVPPSVPTALPPSHRLSSTPIFPSPLAQALFDDDSLDNFDINDDGAADRVHEDADTSAALSAAAASAQSQRTQDLTARRRSDVALSPGRWSTNPRRSPNQSLKGRSSPPFFSLFAMTLS